MLLQLLGMEMLFEQLALPAMWIGFIGVILIACGLYLGAFVTIPDTPNSRH
ncbi:MAG: hypothetical protein RPV21_01360 [Candidatus Sedimenticola sp. (ex Thyasira tokunagai)]